jgi:hypothetical protein
VLYVVLFEHSDGASARGGDAGCLECRGSTLTLARRANSLMSLELPAQGEAKKARMLDPEPNFDFSPSNIIKRPGAGDGQAALTRSTSEVRST